MTALQSTWKATDLNQNKRPQSSMKTFKNKMVSFMIKNLEALKDMFHQSTGKRKRMRKQTKSVPPPPKNHFRYNAN